MNSTNNSKEFSSPPGWSGLIPGMSKLTDAIDRLGAVEQCGRYSNANWYEFAQRSVHIVILDGESTILKFRVLSKFSNESIPKDFIEAKNVFGELEQTETDHSGTIFFEKPGLRIACDFLGNPKLVRWIEFYRPSQQA